MKIRILENVYLPSDLDNVSIFKRLFKNEIAIHIKHDFKIFIFGSILTFGRSAYTVNWWFPNVTKITKGKKSQVQK